MGHVRIHRGLAEQGGEEEKGVHAARPQLASLLFSLLRLIGNLRERKKREDAAARHKRDTSGVEIDRSLTIVAPFLFRFDARHPSSIDELTDAQGKVEQNQRRERGKRERRGEEKEEGG